MKTIWLSLLAVLPLTACDLADEWAWSVALDEIRIAHSPDFCTVKTIVDIQ